MRNSIGSTLLQTVYPKRCKLCGEVIEFDGELCDECKSIKRIQGKICDKCGRNTENCVCKKSNFKPDFNAYCAAYYYEGSVKTAIRNFKDSNCKFLKTYMAKEIYDTVMLRYPNVSFDFVCSVPMRKADERKRGYNQSELLAKEVAKLLNKPYKSALIKIIKTKPQKRASAKKRRENLFGAFKVDDNTNVKEKTVLIVDDVKTTGSSLSECAAMLKIAGAKKVYACSFAVTNKK